MNAKLEALWARISSPRDPTQWDIELVKAGAAVVQADAIERIAIALEKDAGGET